MSRLPRSAIRRVFRRTLLYGTLGGFAAICAAELGARLVLAAGWSPGLEYVRANRALHCRDTATGLLLLCPNQSIAFQHPGGFRYQVSTNERGERLVFDDTAAPDPSAQSQSLWLVGDSIAMAFGNDDADAASTLLARARPGLHVRNLGVDSLGACGIERLLRERLSALTNSAAARGSQPDWIVWIFNPSDYLDDLAPPPRPLLTPALDFLKRWLVLPDALRHHTTRTPYAMPATNAIAANHPTLRCARAFFTTVRTLSPAARPVLLVYPDIAPDRSGPMSREASAALKAPLVEIAREAGVDVLDLQAHFEQVSGELLYLPNDGHPAPRAQRLFAEALADRIPSPPGSSQ